MLATGLGSRIFAVGAYVGEVLRPQLGGEWIADDDDPQAEIDIALRLPDGTTCWPMQRAMKRFKNGPEVGIVAYGLGMGLDVGPKPEPTTRKPWWRFW